MHPVFGVALFLLSLTLPFWLIILLLLIVKHKINISFKISSIYSISNIKINYINNYCTFFIFIQNIRLTLTWFRVRFLIINSDFTLNFLKDEEEGTHESKVFFENYENFENFSKNKTKYSEILQQIFLKKNKNGNKLISGGEIYNLNSMLITRKMSWKDFIISQFLNLFDLYFSKITINVQFKKAPYFHSLKIRKIIVGVVKSKNKNTEIDLLGAVYDLDIFEYQKINCSQNSKTSKVFNFEKNKEKESEYYCNKILSLPESVIKIKFGNGFFPTHCSFYNTITTIIEIREVLSDLSTKSIDNILMFIVNILAYRKTNLKTKTKQWLTIEQLILKELNALIKKIQLKVQHLHLNICSNNFLFKHIVIISNEINFQKVNNLYVETDNNGTIKLLSSENIIKFSELKVSQFKQNQHVLITEVPFYSIIVKDSILYHTKTKKTEFISVISSKLSDIDAFLTAQNLDKILEIVITIVDGIDLIQLQTKKNYTINSNYNLTQKNKDYSIQSSLEFNFNNINVILYNNEFLAFARNIYLKLVKNKIKYEKDEIFLNFAPINLSFTTNENNNIINNYYVGNALVKSFVLSIIDTKTTRNIDLSFGDTFAIAHDFHLFYIMKFISEIIGFIFKQGVEKKYLKTEKHKHKRQSFIKLKWTNTEVVNYINKEDVLYGELKNFEIVVDDHLSIPHFKAYHSSALTYNFFYLLDLDNFYIEFLDNENQINLLFEEIFINAYTPRVASFIQKVSTFYRFFPDWIDYYLTLQFFIDEVTLVEKFKVEKSKKKGVKLTFSKIKIGINDNIVSQAAIIQADKQKLQEAAAKSDYQVIKYLREIKKDLLTLIVTDFTIIVTSNKVVTENSNPKINGGYYVDNIMKDGDVNLKFGLIKMCLEQHELLSLKDFGIECHDEYEFRNFNPKLKKTLVILYEKYSLLLYKVKCQSKKYDKIEIYIDNLKFNFEDIKVFDKTLNYTFKCVKEISSLPFDEFDNKVITDTKLIDYDGNFNLTVSNLDGSITSVDPITKEVYNKLDIKIAIFALSTKTKTVYGQYLKNVLELSLHYFVFGFDPSQKSGFPLLIMPLAEANFDFLNNIIRVNIPTEISNKSSYSRLFNEIYTQELNKLVMETKSLTLFINFKYLSTFFKIFEIFWEKTEGLRLSITKKIKNQKKGKNNKKEVNKNNKCTHSLTLQEKSTPKVEENTYQNSMYLHKGKDQLSSPNINVSNYSSNNSSSNDKFMLSLFDLKVIYLLEYKKEYEPYFKFHPFVKVQRYFGYIFRLYSFSLKYELTSELDSFWSSMNLLTISFLDDDNFSDDDFFVNDREIQTTEFMNLKLIENFNYFMEFDKSNTLKLINSNLKDYLKSIDKLNEESIKINKIGKDNYRSVSSLKQKQYNDLRFDYRHSLAKISNVNLNSKINLLNKNKDLTIIIDNVKLTWNKFNKDVLMLLLFEDVLLIVDRIILKIDVKKKGINSTTINHMTTNNYKQTENGKTDTDQDTLENISDKKINNGSIIHTAYINNQNNSKNPNNINRNQFNFVFEIKNPQICIQNELKKSTLLLLTKKPIKVVISRFFLVDNIKDFKLEFICDYLALYSAPKCVNNEFIHWIGRSSDNKYYLNENLFGQILETPKIRFLISQQVESWENNEFHTYSSMKINVDKIKGDFESSYFTDFLNIVEVFLFDRGYSFAEEKGYLDSKKKDLQTFKKNEIEFLVKNTSQPTGKKPVQKDISFYLGEVIFNLCKGGKTLIQFLLKNFDGNHEIYTDKSSETHINIRSFHIKNAENNRNDMIFSPLYSERLGDFEDKINILTFTKKDRYFSIGTQSLWYALDYMEFNVRPVIMNISKAQIEFIFDFFFQDQTLPDQEEQLKVIMPGTKGKNEQRKSKEENVITNTSGTSQASSTTNTNKEEDYPIYFKHFKVNETEVLLNFEYGEAHPLNIPRTKLKFGTFDKQEKFYPMNTMLRRFVSHCKKQCIKNLGAIISGLFSSSDNVTYEKKRKENDEENHRKLLFGNK